MSEEAPLPRAKSSAGVSKRSESKALPAVKQEEKQTAPLPGLRRHAELEKKLHALAREWDPKLFAEIERGLTAAAAELPEEQARKVRRDVERSTMTVIKEDQLDLLESALAKLRAADGS